MTQGIVGQPEFQQKTLPNHSKSGGADTKSDNIKEEAARKQRQRLRVAELSAIYTHFTGKSDAPRTPSVAVRASIQNPWIWLESVSGQMFLAYATYVWTDPTLSYLISCAFEVRHETGFIECRTKMRWASPDVPLSIVAHKWRELAIGRNCLHGFLNGALHGKARNGKARRASARSRTVKHYC